MKFDETVKVFKQTDRHADKINHILKYYLIHKSNQIKNCVIKDLIKLKLSFNPKKEHKTQRVVQEKKSKDPFLFSPFSIFFKGGHIKTCSDFQIAQTVSQFLG